MFSPRSLQSLLCSISGFDDALLLFFSGGTGSQWSSANRSMISANTLSHPWACKYPLLQVPSFPARSMACYRDTVIRLSALMEAFGDRLRSGPPLVMGVSLPALCATCTCQQPAGPSSDWPRCCLAVWSERRLLFLVR